VLHLHSLQPSTISINAVVTMRFTECPTMEDGLKREEARADDLRGDK